MIASRSRFQNAAQWAGHTVLDALFPPRCGGCGRFSHQLFCAICRERIVALRAPMCHGCGQPFDPRALMGPLCSACRREIARGHGADVLALSRAVWVFAGPPREAIHRFKYGGKWALAARFAPFLSEKLATDADLRAFGAEVVVPVPLHRQREQRRGFNQSQLLAREVATLCGLSFVDAVTRERATPPQVGLNRAERTRNVEGAFALRPEPKTRGIWENRRVLLVDDVFTTGATLRECARVLRRGGAHSVAALTLTCQISFDLKPRFERPERHGAFLTD